MLRVLYAGIHRGQPHKGVLRAPAAIRSFLNSKLDVRLLPPFESSESSVWEDCVALRNRLIPELERSNEPMLVLGGDHSMAAGTVSATRSVHPQVKVLWIDAHADVNTPASSQSGNAHGMPVAMLTGRHPSPLTCLEPGNMIYLGLRDVEANELEWIRHQEQNGLKCYTINDIVTLGMAEVMRRIQLDVGDAEVHVSFDIDVVDPSLAPGTGTPVPGGLQASCLLTMLRSLGTCNIRCMDLVEVNPDLCGGTLTAELAAAIATDILTSSIEHTDTLLKQIQRRQQLRSIPCSYFV